MTIKVGDTVQINGEALKIDQLFKSGRILTTDGQEFAAGFDIVESV